jgi:hypothetical protein
MFGHGCTGAPPGASAVSLCMRLVSMTGHPHSGCAAPTLLCRHTPQPSQHCYVRRKSANHFIGITFRWYWWLRCELRVFLQYPKWKPRSRMSALLLNQAMSRSYISGWAQPLLRTRLRSFKMPTLSILHVMASRMPGMQRRAAFVLVTAGSLS